MDNPAGSKIYLQPVKLVINTICDLVEMQRAKVTRSKSSLWEGEIRYIVRLYGLKQEYRFSVSDIEGKRCNVRLEIDGRELDGPDKKNLILRQFALLDSMLLINVDTAVDDAGGDTGDE